MTPLVALEAVSAGYGSSVVIDEISATIGEGECVAVLGRNGVGKTTLLSTIVGETRMHGGQLRWLGADISRTAPHARSRLGIGWVPQERGMWKSLTVDEHLAAVARPGAWTIEKAFALFPRLAERRRHRGAQLSGGEQQMLAIARILRTGARLLLLDEPTEGLAPVIVQHIGATIRRLKDDGFTILLVEQNFRFAATLADRHYVMERGRVVDVIPNALLASSMDKLHEYLGV